VRPPCFVHQSQSGYPLVLTRARYEATLADLVERYKGWEWERFPKSHHPELRALPFDADYRRHLLRRGFLFWAVG
jgi:hypothetical protein